MFKSNMLLSVYAILMTIIVISIISLFARNSTSYNDIKIGSLSRDDTLILKGISILMVIFGHIGQVIPGMRLFTPLGAMGVGVFLFCSGYGIEKSYEKHGRKNYWYKRIINVLVPYIFIELLALPLHYHHGFISVLKDLLLIQPLHPFGWYMRFLFIWYIIYYISSYIGKHKMPLLIIAGFVIWALCDSLHAQNAFSFAFGVIIARTSLLENIVKPRNVLIGLLLGVLLFLTRDFIKNSNVDQRLLWNTISLLYYLSLIITTILAYKLISYNRVKLPYKAISLIGVFSYELYLVHGYAFTTLGVSATILSVTGFFVMCVVGSFILNKSNKLIIRSINGLIYHE